MIGAKHGIGYQYADDQQYGGRFITIDGKPKKFFGNCSYLGLELDPRIKAGAIDAIERLGVSLSCSRTYMSSSAAYDSLQLFEEIFQQPSLLMPMTNLASMAVCMTRINPEDALIVDRQVHMTVKIATDLVRVNGAHVETLPHNRMDILEDRIKELSQKHPKIWYFADGVYSMFGDTAPMDDLYELLNRYENFRLFIDDAHGMSWTGPRGAGYVLNNVDYFHQHMYMVTSLAKGFGGSGGVAVFPNERERDIVRFTSPHHIFLSPQNNAAYGANIASCKIHLSDEMPTIQQDLMNKVALFKQLALQLNLPLVNPDCTTPIFYIATGTSELCVQVLHRLMQSGFYINIAAHPAVPKHFSGIRIVVTRNQTEDDIKELLYLLHEVIEDLFPKNQLSKEAVTGVFSGAVLNRPSRALADATTL